MKKMLIPFLILIFISGCKQSGMKMERSPEMASVNPAAAMVFDESAESGSMKTTEPLQQNQVTNSQEQLITGKKIIRDGSMTIKVKNILQARKLVDSMVSELGGYIGNESFNSYEQEALYNVAIRVPAMNFNRLVIRLENGAGEVLSKDINARDVTEEYIDLTTRLNNKRKFIDRYTELLKKAASVKDMLEIEENIRKIEEEIESAEGRLRYLNNLVNFSTLNLILTQTKEFKYRPRQSQSFFERLKESLHKGWKGFVGFLLFMIRLWPFWILAVTGWILYRRYRKNRKVTTGFKKN